MTPVSTSCPICGPGSADTELWPANVPPEGLRGEGFVARQQWDGLHFRWVKCVECGLWRANPRPAASQLARLYSDSPFQHAAEAAYAAETYLEVVRRARRFMSEGDSLLEIGCGNGSFLCRAGEAGFTEVAGVEPSVEAAGSAPREVRDKIVVNTFEQSLFGEARFDMVCCFQTLDHVAHPAEFLRQARSVLRPQGLFVCVSHDVAAPLIRLLGRRAPVLDIQHTYLFDRRTMGLLVERAGFEVMEAYRVRNRYPLRYWLRLAPLPRALKQAGAKALAMLGVEDVCLTLAVGNQAIVARKPLR